MIYHSGEENFKVMALSLCKRYYYRVRPVVEKPKDRIYEYAVKRRIFKLEEAARELGMDEGKVAAVFINLVNQGYLEIVEEIPREQASA